MKLKIIINNELESLHSNMSYKTYETIPLEIRPKLIDNNCFYLGDPNNSEIIIQLDRDIIEGDNNLYLHQFGKDLYYSENEFIEF